MPKFTYLLERDALVTSPYGNRVVNGKPSFHDGIDVQGIMNEGAHIVYDVVNGIVKSSGKFRVTRNQWVTYHCPLVNKKVKGLFVEIESLSHKTKYKFRFVHGKSCDKKVGAVLSSGDSLFRVGNSGCTTGLLTPNNPNDGVHIHLSLWVDGKLVDPIKYFDTYKKNGKTYIRSRKPPKETAKVIDEKVDKKPVESVEPVVSKPTEPPPSNHQEPVESDPYIAVKQSVYSQLHSDLSQTKEQRDVLDQALTDKKGEVKTLNKTVTDLTRERDDAISQKQNAQLSLQRMKEFVVDYENKKFWSAVQLIFHVIWRVVTFQKM